jgi:hypothetical protein
MTLGFDIGGASHDGIVDDRTRRRIMCSAHLCSWEDKVETNIYSVSAHVGAWRCTFEVLDNLGGEM